jgi:cytochrome c biogenesis factor
MAIYTSWLRAEDVDVIADQINPDQSVHFKVFVKPLVNLIWLAGFVFVGGALIALWPDARESRRFAERYERAVGVRA